MKRLAIYLIFFSSPLFAQDIIFKNDKSEVKAKVLEILDREVKYKKWDFMEGPTYSMRKNEIFMIIYENGSRETFNERAGRTVQTPRTPTPAKKSTSVVTEPDRLHSLPQAVSRTIESQSLVSPPDSSTIANTVESEEEILPVPTSKYIFTPRDRSLPKSRANRTEGYHLLGLRVNFGTGGTGGAGISYGVDKYKWGSNIGLHTDFKFGGGYYTETTDDLLLSISIGPTYAFNNLLKINKEKAVLFAGVYFRGSYIHGLGYYEVPGINILSGTMGFRAGGSLIFRKKAGVFGEFRNDGYGTAFKVGVSILRLKKN